MHPMFVKPFLEAGADDLADEEEEQQRTVPGPTPSITHRHEGHQPRP